MTSLLTRNMLKGLVVVLCLAAVGVLAISSGAFAQERPARPQPIDPEKLNTIWRLEARCVAGALEMNREDAGKVVKAYVSARQDYSKKVSELPRTREAFQQRRELAEKASAGLKEALTKAVGAEKTGKIMGLLSPAMSGFRLDRMVGDLIDFKLPREKLRKAVSAVLEYNRDLSKALAEARESGSFEGAREKMTKLNEALNKTLSGLLSEEQMGTWKERYARPFGARRGPRPQE